MNEARRFIRYVIPVIVMLVEYLIFLFISLYLGGYPTEDIKKLLYSINAINNGWLFGLIILTGTGVLLSNFYHFIFRITRINLNYKDLFDAFKEANMLEFIDTVSNKTVKVEDITNDGRLRILDAIWHGNNDISRVFRLTYSRNEGLCDSTHSLGTIFVGSVFAFIGWVCTYNYITNGYPSIILISIFFMFIVSNYISARVVSENAQSIISQVIIKEIKHNIKIPKIVYLTRLEQRHTGGNNKINKWVVKLVKWFK